MLAQPQVCLTLCKEQGGAYGGGGDCDQQGPDNDSGRGPAGSGTTGGVRVTFVPTGTGSYELVAETRTVKALKGAVIAPARAVSLEQMEAAIGEGAAESLGR